MGMKLDLDKINQLEDSLKGNINRMCVTDKQEELESMYHWAKKRVSEIYFMNLSRLINIREEKK